MGTWEQRSSDDGIARKKKKKKKKKGFLCCLARAIAILYSCCFLCLLLLVWLTTFRLKGGRSTIKALERPNTKEKQRVWQLAFGQDHHDRPS